MPVAPVTSATFGPSLASPVVPAPRCCGSVMYASLILLYASRRSVLSNIRSHCKRPTRPKKVPNVRAFQDPTSLSMCTIRKQYCESYQEVVQLLLKTSLRPQLRSSGLAKLAARHCPNERSALGARITSCLGMERHGAVRADKIYNVRHSHRRFRTEWDL